MDIINDTSSQTVITTLPTITGTYNPLISQTDLNTALATKQNTLTAATNLLGIGSSITAINWNNITLNKPTNFQADWTSTVINKPTVFNPDLTNIYTKTEVDNITTLTNFYAKSQTDTRYVRVSGANSMTGKLTILNGDALQFPTVGVSGGNGDRLILRNGTVSVLPYSIGVNTDLMWYSTPTGGHSFYVNGSSILYIGSPLSTLVGTMNATTALQEAGVNLTSKYLQITTASSVFQSNLSFNSPMTKTGNIVSIDLSAYATAALLTSNSNLLQGNINQKENILTFSSPLSRATNTVSIDLSSYLTTATAASTYATITNLNAKENTLTFTAPLTRSTNTIGINLSGYATTASLDTTYLRLDGSTSMSSKLLLLTGGNGNPSFATNNGGAGDRIVFASGVAGSVLPYSLGYSLNNLWISAPSGATINNYIDGSIKWSISSSGAILYGTLNATTLQEGGTNLDAKYATITNLNLKENALTFSAPLTRTTNTIGINLSSYATTTALASYLPLAGGQMTGNIGFGIAPSSTILINCSNASSTAFQNIQMMNNIGDFFYFGIAGNAATNSNYLNNFFIQASKGLVLNSMNKTHTGVPDFIINNNSVGINTTAPNTTYKLDVNGGVNATTLYEGGVSLASKYLSSGSFLPLTGGTLTGTLTGTIINANTSLRVANNLVNDFCFNNLGFNHADINDFNAPVGFGCRFIFGNTNGPSVNYGSQTSSYTLFMGLGINYPASGAGSHGCQLALQRSVTNPTLSVRYKENNAWSSWSAITAGVLKGTANFTTNTWQTSSDNVSRFNFSNLGATYFCSGNGSHIFKNQANTIETVSIDNNGGITTTGGVGIGTNVSTASLTIFSSTQLAAKILLTGQEFFQAATTSTNGIAMLLLVNRLGNRQIGFADSANLLVNATNPILRITPNSVDCLSTNGTRLQMSVGGVLYTGANGINIGMNTTTYKSTATVLTVAGGTTGSTQPLVQITQNNAWDGNYALQVKGYANIGGDGSGTGLRINGEDTGNTIFQNGNNNMGLTVNNANMYFNTNGATRMTINNSGNVGIGTAIPRARLDVYDNAMIVRGTNEGAVSGVYICNPFDGSAALKTAIVAQGVSSWSRSKLMFCLNTLADNTTSVTPADARLTIDINGNVAIGQTSAAYPLVVSGTGNSYTITSMSRRYDEIGSIGNTNPYTMTGIVAYLNGNVLSPGFFVSFSDERLKKEIEELSNDFALQTIMKLKPIKYNLIDNIHNNNNNYGFSAQEVQKILPEAVISTKHYLPNIYQNVDKVDNNNSNIIIKADIISSNLNVNDNIKIINHSNEEQIKKIVSINDNVITLDSKIDNYNDGDPLFVYGKEQEDIKCVNHNFLYNVNIKATQVLYEIIMKQQEEIIKLTNVLITSNIISPL